MTAKMLTRAAGTAAAADRVLRLRGVRVIPSAPAARDGDDDRLDAELVALDG
jgi:hypothetical protein